MSEQIKSESHFSFSAADVSELALLYAANENDTNFKALVAYAERVVWTTLSEERERARVVIEALLESNKQLRNAVAAKEVANLTSDVHTFLQGEYQAAASEKAIAWIKPEALKLRSAIETVDLSSKQDGAFTQPLFTRAQKTEQAVTLSLPQGILECMKEASGVLSGEQPERGPLSDELYGFALMLEHEIAEQRVNVANAQLEMAAVIVENLDIDTKALQYKTGECAFELDNAARKIRGMKVVAKDGKIVAEAEDTPNYSVTPPDFSKSHTSSYRIAKGTRLIASMNSYVFRSTDAEQDEANKIVAALNMGVSAGQLNHLVSALKAAKIGLRDWETAQNRYAALDAINAALDRVGSRK